MHFAKRLAHKNLRTITTYKGQHDTSTHALTLFKRYKQFHSADNKLCRYLCVLYVGCLIWNKTLSDLDTKKKSGLRENAISRSVITKFHYIEISLK